MSREEWERDLEAAEAELTWRGLSAKQVKAIQIRIQYIKKRLAFGMEGQGV